jgi:hypothetical protein
MNGLCIHLDIQNLTLPPARPHPPERWFALAAIALAIAGCPLAEE